MRKILIVIILSIIPSFAFAQQKITEKSKLLNSFLNQVLYEKNRVSMRKILSSGIKDFSNYNKLPIKNFRRGYPFKISGFVPKITTGNGVITIEYSDVYPNNPYEESSSVLVDYYILENKFILSYTLGVQRSQYKTFIYDLVNNKITDYDIYIERVNNNIGFITRDYYDDRDPFDPNYQGHIFENGKINLNTGETTWTKQ